MAFKIVIKKEAEEDIYNAYSYYESLQQGLGDRFLELLFLKLNTVQDNPELGGYISTNGYYRDVLIDVFPYLVIYKIDAEEVIVYMVHNTHKKPRY